MRDINIKEEIEKNEDPLRSIYISSYTPRKCGIANYTKDLTTAINNLNPLALAEIIAMDDVTGGYEYPWEVKTRINKTDPESYITAGEYINRTSADVVNLQHEFGLFGGNDGDYLLPMLDMINKPIITCFHSILPDPNTQQKLVMKRIIEKSAAIIAMSETSRELLVNVYDAPDKSALLIYHGVPDLSFNESIKFKRRLKIKAERMLLVSGLISPGKGFEYVIEALPGILKEFPSTVLYVVGQTHPDLLKNKKDEYRTYLKSLVKKHGLEKVVKFVNKYVSLEDLMKYYRACDVYLTPHLDPQQAASGTLAYALGAGKVCISTPYIYAKEMLGNDTGILVPFRSSKAISEEVVEVFSNENLYNQYREKSYKLGKLMQWPRVGYKYLKLFRLIKQNYE